MEIFIILSVVFLLVVFQESISEGVQKLIQKRKFREFLAKEAYYHRIVSENIRYYNKLTREEQRKFLFRTYLFQKQKKFHYIEVEPRPEMPVLVSAVAVQLTLGLEKFSLDYFKNIFILKEDYHYGYYSRPFQGHVDHSGIYLSWDNFNRGIQGLTPNCNVGLHEMAHGLAYVNFITQSEEDKHFKKEFRQFSKVARPIFNAMQQGYKTLLGEYAGTNYHEFWAVCVEVFFENPVRFRHELPELYDSMTRLLKQNPIEIFMQRKMAA